MQQKGCGSESPKKYELEADKSAQVASVINSIHYQLLFESSAEGMLMATAEGTILDANPEACRILRRTREEIMSTGLDRLFDPSDPRLESALEEQRRTGKFKGELRLLRGDKSPFLVRVLRSDKTSFPAEVSSATYQSAGREMITVIFRDVSERKQEEETLRRSEERYRSLIQYTSDIISVIEADGTVSYMSPATERMLGYRPEDQVNTKAFDAIDPDDVERALSIFAEVLDKPGVHLPIEFKVPHADGSWRYLEHVVNNQLDHPSVKGIVVSSRDITERKLTEEAMRKSEKRLQDLVGKLLTAQEEERRRVAYEIHDGLAQVASAAHQHMQAFAGRYNSGLARDREKLNLALELVRQTVEDARRVIADLRPAVLDDFGLAAAIRQKIEALRTEGWEATYEGPPEDVYLPEAVETSLYRVVQEALNNTRKHAGTKRVHVELRRVGKSVRLEIRDRGRGFSLTESSIGGAPGEKVGLSSMRERVSLLGGDIKFHSQPGMGTSIVVEVSLSTRVSGEADYAGEPSPR